MATTSSTVTVGTSPTAICAARDYTRTLVTLVNNTKRSITVGVGDQAPLMADSEGYTIPIGATMTIDGREANSLIYAKAAESVDLDVTITTT